MFRREGLIAEATDQDKNDPAQGKHFEKGKHRAYYKFRFGHLGMHTLIGHRRILPGFREYTARDGDRNRVRTRREFFFGRQGQQVWQKYFTKEEQEGTKRDWTSLVHLTKMVFKGMKKVDGRSTKERHYEPEYDRSVGLWDDAARGTTSTQAGFGGGRRNVPLGFEYGLESFFPQQTKHEQALVEAVYAYQQQDITIKKTI